MDDLVTLILPKDITLLQDKYAEVLAEVVSELLTKEELEEIISNYS